MTSNREETLPTMIKKQYKDIKKQQENLLLFYV